MTKSEWGKAGRRMLLKKLWKCFSSPTQTVPPESYEALEEERPQTAVPETLPYFSVLRAFEQAGHIPKREHIYGSGPPSSTPSLETLHLIKKYAGKRILDVGCGIGTYTKALCEEGYECLGIEQNQGYVEECQNHGLDVCSMDAQHLEFPRESFDTVIFIEVLEHLPEPLIALQEAFRVAKHNVIISVPNIDVIPIMSKYQVVPWHLLEATHLNFFTPKLLDSTLRKFAQTTEVFTYGHFAPWITEQEMHMHIYGVGWKS